VPTLPFIGMLVWHDAVVSGQAHGVSVATLLA